MTRKNSQCACEDAKKEFLSVQAHDSLLCSKIFQGQDKIENLFSNRIQLSSIPSALSCKNTYEGTVQAFRADLRRDGYYL